MSWEVCRETRPVARKEYPCDAYKWIINCGLSEEDLDEEDIATLKRAAQENYRILAGTRYVHLCGKYEGEWGTFRARIDLDAICKKYGIYPD